ncbi:hypothetical protein N5U55_10600 [Aliarcobacter butzleri]|uniref:hypothetical protein n=1 Tax=Aliarcobacter butzleri TaxID=28197 RepID=UPI0021B21FAF|nr:hypothetical protein [Aliarcobacter butzleri]MCT7584559.1 hypothetical protein [Aliarcobacter butzleri]
MEILSGFCNLNEFYKLIDSKEDCLNIDFDSNFLSKINPFFIEKLLVNPFIFYVKNGSFSNSSNNIEFSEIVHSIIKIENMYLLALLKNFKNVYERLENKEKYKLKFIAIQLEEKDEDISKSSLLSKVISLGNLLEQGTTVGKIDIQKFENEISKELKREELEDCIRHFRGNVLQQLYKLQPKESKKQHINKKFKLITDYELEYNSINKDLLFKVECPFCEKYYNVSLNNDNSAVTKLENIFEFRNVKDIEKVFFKCDHINSNNENNVEFSFRPKFKLDDCKYKYALIQYFFEFKIDKENTLLFFDSQKKVNKVTIKKLMETLGNLNG